MAPEESPQSDTIENLVYRFELKWIGGESPAIDDFLSEIADDQQRELLVELAHVDLEFRLKAGETAQVEQYFEKFPDLNGEHDDVLQLIVAEFNLRSRNDPRPSPDEYGERFPEYWDQLQPLLTNAPAADHETHFNSHPLEATVTPARTTTGSSPPLNQQPDSRYEIVENHASGGLGDVFVARDAEIPRDVALKQLKPQFAHDADSQSRFLREAEITGGLEHPGIVPVYGMGVYEDGRPYYAMRFIRGGSFRAAITRYHETMKSGELSGYQTLKLRKLLTRFIEVCHAVDYAHSRGVVHRDIKPSNIMVGTYGETLVVDWGLAKAIGRMEGVPRSLEVTIRPLSGGDSAATQLGSAVGTPAYMSPEQALGQVDDLRPTTDVFCLGGTLYELLTGQAPQTSRDLSEVLNRVRHGKFPRPRSLNANVPVGLEAICLKAMALNPGDRYQSAGALAADLENWLADEPVAAHRESRWDRLRRWMRHHRSTVTSTIVAGVLLAVAGVVGLIAWDHYRQEDLRQLGQLQATASADEQSALTELRGDRYSSALVILNSALEQLEVQPRLEKLQERIALLHNRIERLDNFHRFANQAEELAIFENDRGAILACRGALDSLDVFEHADWWAHLPVRDLMPEQIDRLRQRVYDQLILLMMLKGKSAIFNFMSPAAAQESRDLLVLAEFVQSFRRAESIAALESLARFRTGAGLKFPDFNNLQPVTAADNSTTGLMYWSIAQNPVVRQVVLREQTTGSEPIDLARKYLTRATHLDPNRYTTNVTLGFIDGQIKEYASARQAFNHCILLRPEACLAYSMRSDMFLREAKDLRAAGREEDHQRVAELLRDGLRDAEKARDLAPTTYYVYWTLGRIHHEMGQPFEAVHAFLKALRLGKTAAADEQRLMDHHLIEIERTKVIATELVRAYPQVPDYRLLLATLESELMHDQEAFDSAQQVLEMKSNSAEALVIRANVWLRRGDFKDSQSDFESALQIDETNYRANMGLGRARERLENHAEALKAYDRGVSSARTEWQIAEAQLGRCSALIRLRRFPEAVNALKVAMKVDTGCDVDTVRELAERSEAATVIAAIENTRPSRLNDRTKPPQIEVLPLLNGDFELGFSAYWGESHRDQPIWWNHAGCRSFAEVTNAEKHSGELSLNIRHESPSADGVFAETSQAVPATAEKRYRVQLWAKARELAINGAYFVIGSESNIPIVNLPAGTYDWVPLEGEFTAAGDQALVRIVTRDVGEVWLDDIRIELAD